jgi:hypothetical protein
MHADKHECKIKTQTGFVFIRVYSWLKRLSQCIAISPPGARFGFFIKTPSALTT